MKDYYTILGVEKTATADDIKKAFRKLAHQHHPDKNKGNEDAAKKFKEASEAYATLSDATKRAQYDRFGSAGPGGGYGGAGGQGNPFGGAGQGGGFGGFDFSQFTQQQGGFGNFSQNGQSFEFDLNDLFGDFFGGGRGGARRPRKGRNISVDIQLTFKESIFGIEREIGNGKERFMVKIPAGIENGQTLRVGEKGEEGEGGRGDLLLRIWVEENAHFRKEGLNLVMELGVKLTTALTGGTVEVETLDGKIDLKIPSGTSHGEILRVKGKGVPYESRGTFTSSVHSKRGDLLIVTHVTMPRKLSKNAQKLVEELKGEGI
jgi:DnaJ-class molecular chaperone